MDCSIKHGECPTNESLKDESGLSLIESMMAMLILLVGLLAMVQVLVFGVITSKTVGRDAGKTTASAHDKMEELTGLQFSDTTTNVAVAPPYPANGMGLVAGGSIYPSSPAAGYSDYLDKTGGRTTGTAAAYTRQWQIVNDSATVKRIIVTVTSNKGFKYGKAPSTILVAQKTP